MKLFEKLNTPTKRNVAIGALAIAGGLGFGKGLPAIVESTDWYKQKSEEEAKRAADTEKWIRIGEQRRKEYVSKVLGYYSKDGCTVKESKGILIDPLFIRTCMGTEGLKQKTRFTCEMKLKDERHPIGLDCTELKHGF